ncbi:MAG: hypothetical protein ACJAZO_002820 [Myxococcota bacterium]|jgi:hypothetical protein
MMEPDLVGGLFARPVSGCWLRKHGGMTSINVLSTSC